MDRHDPAWEERLRAGPVEADALLAAMRPLVSVMVRPVDAYRLVADVLASDHTLAVGGPADGDGAADRDEVVRRASGSGSSTWLSACCAAQSRSPCCCSRRRFSWPGTGDCSDRAEDVGARRTAFLAELRDLLRRLDEIENLAIRRYVQDAVSVPPTE